MQEESGYLSHPRADDAVEAKTPGSEPAGNTGPGDSGEESLSQEELEKIYAGSFERIREGEIVRGRVVSIEKDMVLVDIGYKSEGVIPIWEFPRHGRDLRVGEEVEVYLEEAEDTEGLVVLSKEKANRIKIWDDISRAYENNRPVEGEVISRIKGGLTVDIGLKAFLPGSQVDLRPVRNLEKLIGQRLQMKIIKLNRKRGNIVLSRRVLLEEERMEAKKETLAHLQEGQILEGVVKNITEYGAFVDLGGIDGLLHITDMSWGRVNHPSDLFAVGDRIKVIVLKYDRETERVSLGYKQITPDPWSKVEEKYPIGSRVKGKVVSITDYGAFVELEEGIEGLVHISEMSWTRRVRHPSKVVAVGDVVEAQILNVNKEEKRISLGMKQVEPNPWTTIAEKYPVGSEVEGKVRNLTDFGAFISLEEGIDGLIHVSDMSWTQKVKHPSEILKKGQKLRAVVLSIDQENERLSLGMKQLSEDPWKDVAQRYRVGQDIRVRVVKVTNFGAFAELEPGIEGLVHVSELGRGEIDNPEKVVKQGDELDVKVIKMDVESRKIGLSVRARLDDQDKADIARYGQDVGGESTIADLLSQQSRRRRRKERDSEYNGDADSD
ncbi:MAG: 30S ribosomal protein S1 [Candidatus Tectomicrobia bacterium]|uniref:Small ribosomal subunit protein bS1 n=1 Tax=Tectimicrobiota bacterium TaxID=2528274 RepID=A0A932GMT8_UNCTE|nr:30S ribosomal protein S1 [Candidatus Tectomicrobia bacterium]